MHALGALVAVPGRRGVVDIAMILDPLLELLVLVLCEV